MTLPKFNKENGILLLIILLIGAWIGTRLFTPKVKNSIVIEEIIKTDTIMNVVDTVFSAQATKKKPFVPKKVQSKKPEQDPEPESYDSIRSYSGSNVFDYGKFDWEISTGGVLESYKFNPQFEIPTITIEKERTITQTRTIIQKGVFVGGGVSTQMDFHFGATYLGDKFMIEYNFIPAQGFNSLPNTVQVHQIGVKYKIF
jgi:hypothetical protein